MSTIKKLKGVDARGLRGVFSRGYAGYGVSGAPRTGNLAEVAKRRLLEKRKKLATGRYNARPK